MTTTVVASAARARRSSAASAAYAGFAYLTFLVASGYAVAFLADVGVPRTVDHGGPISAKPAAVAIDVLLLALFAVQHTVMARPQFKRWLTRSVPAHLERSSYVLATTLVFGLLFWQWRPIPTVAWHVSPAPARTALWVLYGAGWAWAVAMTFAIDHFELFGLRQVARRLRGVGAGASAFRTPWPYRLVRHPMMIGFAVAFVAAPTMTAGHLLFAGLGCAYIVVGVWFEERDLTSTLPEYRAYAASTPRFIPRFARRSR